MLRYYKPTPERIRPTDRMVAHTGYLVFSRPIVPVEGRFEGVKGADKEPTPENEGEKTGGLEGS